MMAWIAAFAIALSILLAFVLLGRVPRRSWELVAATLFLGLAGYALQGSPDAPAAPARLTEADSRTAEQLLRLQAQMAPNFDVSKNWTITSDAFARSGKYSLAVAYARSGLKEHPENSHLWAALGLYMMLASDGRITPPSEFAFAQARRFKAKNPAPDYFEGLFALVSGKPVDAAKLWESALEKAPKESQWEPAVRRQLDGLRAMMQRAVEGDAGGSGDEE